MKHPFRFISVALVLSAVTATWVLRAADRPTPAPEPIVEALVGAWVQVEESGAVDPVPRLGARLKFRAGQRWTFTHADPATGVVTANFAGTYSVRGNEYFETIDYSTDAHDPELRKTLKFIVSVEGDTMTQRGVGNPYTEVWKRIR